MDKKTTLLCFFLFIITLPYLSFAQEKVTVTAENAKIYAEPHERAHLIESVKKGTELTLFQKGIIRDAWYYVSFYSQRYRGRTTGFIRVDQVELWSEATPIEIKPPVETIVEELPPAKKPAPKAKVKPPPTPEPEAKKEPEVRIEESQTTTLLPSPKVFSIPREEIEMGERTWLLTDLEFVYTALPKPIALSFPSQHPTPQDLYWRTSETESTVTQAPAGQALKHLEAQDTLKTKEYIMPKPPPQPKPAASSYEPAEIDYSDSVHLTRTSDSLEFNLTIGPYSRFRHFEMTEPNRIVMDFFEVSENADFQQHQLKEMGIESIRIAMFEETTARVVFDFLEEIPAYQIEQTENGLKLQFWSEAAEPQEQVETRPQPAQKPPPPPEPEPIVEEVTADTGLPAPKAWIFPPEQTVLSELVWTAREESFTSTPLPPGLALNLPMSQLPPETIFWTVAPPALEVKEDVVEPPVVKPPVEAPPKTIEKAVVEPEKKKEEKKEEVVKEKPPEQIIQSPEVSPQISPPRETGPVTVSLGVGASTGGAGGFVQYNTKGGMALHAGIGMYPTSFVYSGTDWVKNEMLYSVGVKYYLPFKSQYLRPYIDVQYGGFAIEAVQIIVGIWEYQYIYQNEQKALYGPTALVGGEVRLGTLGLNLAAGVSYAASAWEWKSQDFYFSFDLSLIYNFK